MFVFRRTPTSFRSHPKCAGHLVAEEFQDGPSAVYQSRGHSWRTFLPLGACSSSQMQALMIPTEIVGTAHQIHPSREHRFIMGDGAASSDQPDEGTVEGGVNPISAVTRLEEGSPKRSFGTTFRESSCAGAGVTGAFIVRPPGAWSNDSLWRALRGHIPELYLIGDANRAANSVFGIGEAVRSGHQVGHQFLEWPSS
jgi:hypothetical protein